MATLAALVFVASFGYSVYDTNRAPPGAAANRAEETSAPRPLAQRGILDRNALEAFHLFEGYLRPAGLRVGLSPRLEAALASIRAER